MNGKAPRSPSKRSVIYPAKNATCPVRTKAGKDPAANSTLYRFRGDVVGDPNAYVTDDGKTLVDLVGAVAGQYVAKGFSRHRYRTIDALLNRLGGFDIYATRCSDLSIVAGRYSIVYDEAKDYDRWLDGDVFRVAEVDDPSDDTGRTLYVDDVSQIPGRIIRKRRGVYSYEDAQYTAAEFGMENAPKRDWRFHVGQRSGDNSIGYDDAVRLGYDGRDMKVGDYMEVGPLVIQRVDGHLSGYFAPDSDGSEPITRRMIGPKAGASGKMPAKAPAKKTAKPKGKSAPKSSATKPKSKGGRR